MKKVNPRKVFKISHQIRKAHDGDIDFIALENVKIERDLQCARKSRGTDAEIEAALRKSQNDTAMEKRLGV